ncbi:flagellar basal body P-ring formation chaperone FlgA [Marinobacterium mangrovicola]|nr:flagellar basal body P-ring formation chaperone FlgA [Marinobacterium mangrovicola]
MIDPNPKASVVMPYRTALHNQDSGVNFRNIILFGVLIATFLAFPSRSSFAASDINSDIENQVKSTIEETYRSRVPDSRTKVTVNPTNRTLSLTPCAHSLVIDLPFASGERVTAKVSCSSPRPWSLFVTARVEQFIDVVTARRPIPRNTKIQAGALTLSEQNVMRLRGDYFTRLQDVAGQTARTPIDNGEVISPRVLEATLAVRRGDQITLEARKGSLVIRTKGVALEDGHLNQQIDIKNLRSGRELRGTVTAPGTVRMD